MDMQRGARLYRGLPVEERRAERRAQLITAAIKVYGERGYRAATVKAVCDTAGLTERYFYESFANSEALLVAAVWQVMRYLNDTIESGSAGQAPGTSSRARGALTAYFTALQRHPRQARAFLAEIAGVSAEVDRLMDQALDRFADLLAPASADLDVGGADRLLRRGVMGGVIQIALSWIGAGYVQPLEDVVETALRLCALILPRA